MGKCIYCGNGAGLFRKKHRSCEKKYAETQVEVLNQSKIIALQSASVSRDIEALRQKARDGYLPEDVFASLVGKGLDIAMDDVLQDGLLSEEEESKMTDFLAEAGKSGLSLNSGEAHQRLVKNSMLRELMNGVIPAPYIRVAGELPVFLQKNESLLWVEASVEYYELRSRTHYEGRSSGVSVRIMKGVYYRTGAFKGNPVNVTELKFIAEGVLVLTSRHIYFHSPAKSFKIPFTKLVSLQPYSDGISLHRDALTAKPQVFKGIDGWFLFNAVSNLRELQAE